MSTTNTTQNIVAGALRAPTNDFKIHMHMLVTFNIQITITVSLVCGHAYYYVNGLTNIKIVNTLMQLQLIRRILQKQRQQQHHQHQHQQHF
jgi:hypothetical protein